MWLTSWRDQKQPSLCCHFNHTWSTPLLAVCLKLFFPSMDIQQALLVLIVQHTQCPCRFILPGTWYVLSRQKKLCSHQLQDRRIYTSQIHNKIPGTCIHKYMHGILMREASGLFSWSMAAGLLAFSSRQFCTLSVSDHIIFPSWASAAGGVCLPRSEAPYIYAAIGETGRRPKPTKQNRSWVRNAVTLYPGTFFN